MIAASCFSGIGGAELALPEATWLWSAEVDPFANAVRAARLPHDNNLGDVLTADFIERAASFGPLDLLAGGPPCQDFSIAGLRAGLDGDRGNLTLRWVRIARELRPRYLLTENVPGWLSVGGGHAFGAFVAGLVGHDTALVPPKNCGGRWTDAGMADGPDGRLCWRILDAQFHGLAQRRRRVFVVFCPTGSDRDCAQVLLERQGVQRDSAPRREAWERTAGALAASVGGCDENDARDGRLIAFDAKAGANTGFAIGDVPGALRGAGHGGGHAAVLAYGGNRQSGALDVATAVNAHGGPHGRIDFESETFVCGTLTGNGDAHSGFKDEHGLIAHSFHENQRAEMTLSDTAGSLKVGVGKPGQGYPAIVTHSLRADGFDASEDGTGRGTPLVTTLAIRGRGDSHDLEWREDGTANALLTPNGGRAGMGCGAIKTLSSVRRLTPTEAERLQGYPDGWTAIAWRGKPAADGNRYRALGNSWAIPCVRWIMLRILRAEAADAP